MGDRLAAETALGDMGVGEHEALNTIETQPGAEPIDQGIMALPGSVMRDHLGLGALERVGMDHIEPDQVETETGVEIVMQAGDALGEQAGDHAGIAQRPGRLHAEID
jgi:hypothetical protein